MIKIVYDGPMSVHKIMDVAGTTGINNTDSGLWVLRGDIAIRFMKGETACIHDNGKITKLKEDLKYA